MGSATERENLVFTAKLAQQAGLHNEMVDAMRAVVDLDHVGLTIEEKNLFSIAYKNVIDLRRSSWKSLSSAGQTEEAKGNDAHMMELNKIRRRIEREISCICRHIMEALDELLIPRADGESAAFYLKLKGDFYRYVAEVRAGHEKQRATKESKKAYEKAMAVARAVLPPTHPVRLGVALHLSIFYHQILNDPEEACRLVKIAFDEGIGEIDSLKDEAYKSSLSALNLIRENYTLWTRQLEA